VRRIEAGVGRAETSIGERYAMKALSRSPILLVDPAVDSKLALRKINKLGLGRGNHQGPHWWGMHATRGGRSPASRRPGSAQSGLARPFLGSIGEFRARPAVCRRDIATSIARTNEAFTMPSDDGLRLHDRQSVHNARCKPIEDRKSLDGRIIVTHEKQDISAWISAGFRSVQSMSDAGDGSGGLKVAVDCTQDVGRQ
jgi:hypothetical protein